MSGSINGKLLSNDNGLSYVSMDSWTVHVEERSSGSGGFSYRHDYDGPASPSCIDKKDPCITISGPFENPKGPEYDSSSRTFTIQVCGVDQENGDAITTFCIPTDSGPNRLKGSSTSSDGLTTTSWSFAPDIPQCSAKGDSIPVTLNPITTIGISIKPFQVHYGKLDLMFASVNSLDNSLCSLQSSEGSLPVILTRPGNL